MGGHGGENLTRRKPEFASAFILDSLPVIPKLQTPWLRFCCVIHMDNANDKGTNIY